MKKLVLDAGHGYNTGGKRTLNGANGIVREWTMNNNVAKYAAELLKDYDVEITRVDDTTGNTDVPLLTRTNKINQIKPDLFVSVHHNANTGVWGNWSYVCAFYNVKKPKRDVDLAVMFAAEISKLTGIKNNGGLPDTRAAQGSIHMVRETLSTIPSVLCKGGFMDSTIDYPIITSEKGQKAYGQAIANVCISYLGLKKNINNPIMGKSILTAAQMAAFLLGKNSKPLLTMSCTALQLAEIYINEGNLEGVRGDVAFCQAMQETGYFKYGGDVLPEQNNYCGYAATNSTAKGRGAWFTTPQEGVRCHIQHLKAYGSKEPLRTALVQPSNGVPNRFGFVSRGIAPDWTDLNGRWAVPGVNYRQSILKIYDDMTAHAKANPQKHYKIQLGAYGVKQNADNMLARVKSAGLDAFVTPLGADKLYRVQFGAFANKTNADAKLREVHAKGFHAIIKHE